MAENLRDLSSKLMQVRFAESGDAEALALLINEAFVVEQPIFGGDRTNKEQVSSLLEKGKFLVADHPEGLAGCVYAEVRGDRGYIGLLSVKPAYQGTGLGRKLMNAAEDRFRKVNCVRADLRVISARTGLPAFYRHLGYRETHVSDLPADARPKVPCQYIHMSKELI